MYWIFIFIEFIKYKSFKCNSIRCISLKNQECKVTPKIVDINSNNPIFYLSVKINKCGGNCNNINDPYAEICVLDTAKDLNVKVFI